jgi:hypothetical protein
MVLEAQMIHVGAKSVYTLVRVKQLTRRSLDAFLLPLGAPYSTVCFEGEGKPWQGKVAHKLS